VFVTLTFFPPALLQYSRIRKEEKSSPAASAVVVASHPQQKKKAAQRRKRRKSGEKEVCANLFASSTFPRQLFSFPHTAHTLFHLLFSFSFPFQLRLLRS
jgi:hypothetical protein